jgi:IS605 OrfB family transposase
MQTTLTASLIDDSHADFINQKLDQFNTLFNKTKRNLYKDIIKFYSQNNTNKLSTSKINQLKSSYQTIFCINSRHYNSIFNDLLGNINSILELNKDYIVDTKDNITSLSKSLKSKQSILDSLVKKMSAKNYIENNIDKTNKDKLVNKIFYLKKRLNKANNKLVKLLDIEKSGNPHLCFGSKKLFNQQFMINTKNNLTSFKFQEDWKKAWIESRNRNFIFIGSKDETAGNSNCQIKHIENDIYQVTVNVDPKATKHKDKYITFNIKVYNDKNNYLLNSINNNSEKDKSKHQALTYRFYKYNGKYQVFISLDKDNQQPKIISHRLSGAIGIDINSDHLSVSEIDRFGNLKKTWNIQLNLKDKTTEQSLDNIACAVKEITDYVVKVGKPIVIEKLNFNQKKSELKSGFNKKYNVMLSSFAYRKIIELIKSRSFDKGIEIIEVNPAYTSKIGKFKYQNQYKLTTHQAASFVIARRGLLSYEKYKNIRTTKINKETKIKAEIIERKPVTVVHKEKPISNRRSKYYPFGLPVRNSQKQDGIYWKEIEQNYLKAKKHRIVLKRKKLILGNNGSKLLSRETTVVADNSEVDRDLSTNLLFQPF